jgi:hypothetical protein
MIAAVGLSWIGGVRGSNRNVARKHKLILGVTGAVLGAFLQGC